MADEKPAAVPKQEPGKPEQARVATPEADEQQKVIASRGIPSKESLYLPAHNSPALRQFEDSGENLTHSVWDLEDVLNFVFPKQYQAKYNEIAVKFMALFLAKQVLEGSDVSAFVKSNSISKATFYNRVLPRLKRIGMIKVERETVVAAESQRKFRPMKIHISKTFGNYLNKIGNSWHAYVETAREKSS
ncbi:MAG TPA: hypothetical protein PLO51_04215, partial [Candidatus Micrarchaeota archaeon]|nr:hypothetical protein [Candidatus Micrarchaeota archaeon]